MQRIPGEPAGAAHVLFEHFWVEIGSQPLPDPDKVPASGRFIITPSISMHLRNLARAVLLRSYPILLQVRFAACRSRANQRDWPKSARLQNV